MGESHGYARADSLFCGNIWDKAAIDLKGNLKKIRKTMRTTFFFSIIFLLIFSSCGGGEKKKGTEIDIKPPVLAQVTDGDELTEAIEIITANTSFWTQERYDTLRTKINSLYAAGIIESAEAPVENLYILSVSCLNNRVDEEFKKSRYDNYAQLKSDLGFLKEDNSFLYDHGVIGEKPDPNLEKVEDIFDNYEAVLRLSKSTFRQNPVFMRAYSGNYTPIKNEIESNKYYKTYFSNNSEITGGVKEFPSRLSAAKKDYYDGMERIIERRIVEGKMSETDCYKIVADFQKLTKNDNQEIAFKKLQNFVENYIEQLNTSDNE